MKKYEAEIEVLLTYSVPVYAESLEDAAVRARGISKEDASEGRMNDFETRLIGVRRDKDSKMYL